MPAGHLTQDISGCELVHDHDQVKLDNVLVWAEVACLEVL